MAMRGHLRLELRSPAGELVARREGGNAVMRGGAELIANLFAGRGVGITHMAVGTSDQPESDAFDPAGLSNAATGGQPALAGATEAALPPESFLPAEVDAARRVVRVRLRATLPPAAAVGTVREAGLLARAGATATLYNRVTFAPLTKGDDHELTMFWEVSFPYGDLQGLL
jgi:hypothetical protein